ncbi:uncharacterized protein K441DRAFT_662960 [Cenococcum geophilum 1.58]|uniref:uncharacterized protein n=1 Tax=Cenococcum geophilum 1.58 TaxID=794803 RepID=UPI00358F9D22|nr:hypothetical protein K441DRAFT_662960 [Cenococcum geophilum 1.58]
MPKQATPQPLHPSTPAHHTRPFALALLPERADYIAALSMPLLLISGAPCSGLSNPVSSTRAANQRAAIPNPPSEHRPTLLLVRRGNLESYLESYVESWN